MPIRNLSSIPNTYALLIFEKIGFLAHPSLGGEPGPRTTLGILAPRGLKLLNLLLLYSLLIIALSFHPGLWHQSASKFSLKINCALRTMRDETSQFTHAIGALFNFLKFPLKCAHYVLNFLTKCYWRARIKIHLNYACYQKE